MSPKQNAEPIGGNMLFVAKVNGKEEVVQIPSLDKAAAIDDAAPLETSFGLLEYVRPMSAKDVEIPLERLTLNFEGSLSD